MLLGGLADTCAKTLKKQKGFELFPSQRKRLFFLRGGLAFKPWSPR